MSEGEDKKLSEIRNAMMRTFREHEDNHGVAIIVYEKVDPSVGRRAMLATNARTYGEAETMLSTMRVMAEAVARDLGLSLPHEEAVETLPLPEKTKPSDRN